eukprot:TRINITY_DN3820_c0_g1_i2.p4 TRINITY_DN3820_c0_g1~~TRINITY_DN3820_c0_g1_i2.p4  ORF type:complete len:104 (+),score=29.26 TRINITY_DN3820_c0_g1_i2:255-566(+)
MDKLDQPRTPGKMLAVADADFAVGMSKSGKRKSEKRNEEECEDSARNELGDNGQGKNIVKDAGKDGGEQDSKKKKKRKRKSDRSIDMDPGTGKRKKRAQMMFS